MRLVLVLAILLFPALSFAQNSARLLPLASRLAEGELAKAEARWDAVLHNAKDVDKAIVHRSLFESGVAETGKSRYGLLGINQDSSLKVVVLLKEVDGRFYLYSDHIAEGIAVACSGCPKASTPVWRDGWRCNSGASDGDVRCTRISLSEPVH